MRTCPDCGFPSEGAGHHPSLCIANLKRRAWQQLPAFPDTSLVYDRLAEACAARSEKLDPFPDIRARKEPGRICIYLPNGVGMIALNRDGTWAGDAAPFSD